MILGFDEDAGILERRLIGQTFLIPGVGAGEGDGGMWMSVHPETDDQPQGAGEGCSEFFSDGDGWSFGEGDGTGIECGWGYGEGDEFGDGSTMGSITTDYDGLGRGLAPGWEEEDGPIKLRP